jgi:4'-phosphopantetheinyl transferase
MVGSDWYVRITIKMINLQTDKAFLYTVDLVKMRVLYELCWRILSTQEKKRVDNFQGQSLKDRYVISHGILRLFLSFYCQVPPHTLAFTYNQYGKPYLLNNPNLYFNMSHSLDYAAYIFCLSHEVGIDIEWKNSHTDVSKLAAELLNPSERKKFYALSFPEQQHVFYELWTQKEAIVKAFGQGMSYPFQAIEAMKSSPSSYHVINENKFYFDSFSSFNNLAGAIAIQNHMPEVIEHEINHASLFDSLFSRKLTRYTPNKETSEADRCFACFLLD